MIPTANVTINLYNTEKLNRLAVSKTGFIFDPQTGQSFTVNHSGRLALELMAQGLKPHEVVKALSIEYDVLSEVVAGSMEAFLLQLERYL